MARYNFKFRYMGNNKLKQRFKNTKVELDKIHTKKRKQCCGKTALALVFWGWQRKKRLKTHGRINHQKKTLSQVKKSIKKFEWMETLWMLYGPHKEIEGIKQLNWISSYTLLNMEIQTHYTGNYVKTLCVKCESNTLIQRQDLEGYSITNLVN